MTKMPVWHYQIDLSDVFHHPDLTFEQRRDKIVERLRASTWIRKCGSDGGPLDQLVQDLAEVVDAEEFDDVWGEIYNYADVDRAWIDTIWVEATA